MPLMSEIDPTVSYVSSYINDNAYFKKQKLSLMIFTCSKSTIKTPEHDAKSFNTKRTNQCNQHHPINMAFKWILHFLKII